MASAAQQDEQRTLLISGQLFGLDLLVENLGEAQACVVTTAAKALPDPLDYVADIEELESIGISCSTLDIEDATLSECEAVLTAADLLVISGGSARYLAEAAATKGFGRGAALGAFIGVAGASSGEYDRKSDRPREDA